MNRLLPQWWRRKASGSIISKKSVRSDSTEDWQDTCSRLIWSQLTQTQWRFEARRTYWGTQQSDPHGELPACRAEFCSSLSCWCSGKRIVFQSKQERSWRNSELRNLIRVSPGADGATAASIVWPLLRGVVWQRRRGPRWYIETRGSSWAWRKTAQSSFRSTESVWQLSGSELPGDKATDQ